MLGVVLLPGGLTFGGGVAPDVVAVGVVGMLAERLLVLGGDLATLGGLLDRQADTTTL